jgi:flagellum-specific peptidoglycan hydrolase FlgJ
MWKLLAVALLCYGLFVYWQSPLAPTLFGEGDAGDLVLRDSIVLYIEQHSALAVAEMQRARIPASITLSQAILESRFGTSLLAQHANNHFGIKANPHWDGNDRHCAYSYEWSARRNGMYPAFSCFRRYKTTQASYSDHSDFLTTRPYYTNLFQLPLHDWRAWAEGLQAAGYATDPNYATKLIDLVERYDLQRFDQRLSKVQSATLQQHSRAKRLSQTPPTQQ